MKTSIFATTMAALSLAFLTNNAAANGPSMTNRSAPWPKSASKTPHTHRPLPAAPRTTTPRTTTTRSTPHYTTPRTTMPRTTTTVVIPQRPRVNPGVTVVSGTTGVAGGTLTNNAHVGYNRTTGRYAIAFDAPGVSGAGILIQSGHSILVLGPTDWNSARSYLKRIEAPGW